jgi:predicted permease
MTMGLGIGVNTNVFTLANAVLFKALPFRNPGQIMYVSSANSASGGEDIDTSYPDFLDWRAQTKAFREMSAVAPAALNISDAKMAPQRYSGARITSNTFSFVGTQPAFGRDFGPADDQPGAPAVVLLSDAIWENRYGRDPNILGRTIRVNGVPTTVVGVMRAGMRYPSEEDAWIPLRAAADLNARDARVVSVAGRLADGVTPEMARLDMARIAQSLEAAYPDTNRNVGSIVQPYTEQLNGGPVRSVFLALLGAVTFVLLIACSNVANLLLARAVSRSREIAVRSALGATRWRIARQLMVESIVYAFMGGVAGMVVAAIGVKLFMAAIAKVPKPYWIDFSMDYRVFAYAAAICLLSGVAFGLAPIVHMAKRDLNEAIREASASATASSRSRYLSAAFVALEFSLAMALLAGAGLMVRSLFQSYSIGRDLDGAHLLTLRLSLPTEVYATNDDVVRFLAQAKTKLESIPGVKSAAYGSNLPFGGAMRWRFEVQGENRPVTQAKATAATTMASESYFETAGIKLVRGRGFNEADGTESSHAAVVNQRFAAKYWPNDSAIGKKIRLVGSTELPWLDIVGVAPDMRQTNANRTQIDPLIVIPFREQPMVSAVMILRCGSSPSTLVRPVTEAIHGMDRDLPVYSVMTLSDFLAERRWAVRVFGIIFALLAGVALALSCVGIYGVAAYSVSRRTAEFGIRVALGARPARVMSMVLAEGVVQLLVGLLIGLGLAFALTRVLSAILFQTRPTDTFSFVAASSILLAAGIAACCLPAIRILRLDPGRALRHE